MTDEATRVRDLLESVGSSGEVIHREWTERDVMLYALAVGAGSDDASTDLHLTTENSPEAQLVVLPSFACVLASAPWPEKFSPDMTKVVHADETVTVLRPLPTSGACSAQMTVTGFEAHRAGAIARLRSVVTNSANGDELAIVEMGLLIRGETFGTAREAGTATEQLAPTRSLTVSTDKNQALLYRLTGDRNPLHSSPKFAKKAGFDQPILHGLATFGLAIRAIIGSELGESTERGYRLNGRFRKPVKPGDQLTVDMWETSDEITFQVLNEAGEIVLDQGVIGK